MANQPLSGDKSRNIFLAILIVCLLGCSGFLLYIGIQIGTFNAPTEVRKIPAVQIVIPPDVSELRRLQSLAASALKEDGTDIKDSASYEDLLFLLNEVRNLDVMITRLELLNKSTFKPRGNKKSWQ